MLTLGAPNARESMIPGSCWKLKVSANGFGSSTGSELVTQAACGRSFQLLDDLSFEGMKFIPGLRIKVKLLEDVCL